MSRRQTRKVLMVAFALFLIALLAITVLLFCRIQRIEIHGNQYLTNEEIIDWLNEDKYASNSLYVWNKYRTGNAPLHSGMEAMEVKIKNPWTIELTVYEKKIVGFLQKDDQYAFFGRDGVVLRLDHEFREEIPLIEGLIVEEAKLYERLKVEREGIFKVILEISQMTEKNELKPSRMMIEDENVYLYIGMLCINVGTENLELRIMQIPPIMEKIGEQKGLLHLENYKNSGDNVPFEAEVWPAEIVAGVSNM